MKPSALQLNYLTYPKLAFSANPAFDSSEGTPPLPAGISVKVMYRSSGEHFAWLTLGQQNVDQDLAFEFEVEVFCTFGFDLEKAKDTYRSGPLPVYLSVNVARLLYSSARELLASATARSPHGAVMLQSVNVEPCDVEIAFEHSPEEQIPQLFGMPASQVPLKKVANRPAPEKSTGKSKKARK